MLRGIRIAAVLLTLHGADLRAPGQSLSPTDTNSSLEDGPTHRITFSGTPRIRSATFSADGSAIFVDLQDLGVNLWEVFIYYWPESLGTLTAITFLVCTTALWRILHRKRLLGEPHCRKCNYCLKGCESERCPECGWFIKRPIIGQSTRRRVLPFAVPLAFMLIVYGSLSLLRVPRSGCVSDWLHWWSYDLAADSSSLSAQRWGRHASRLVKVDVNTGEILDTLVTWRAGSIKGLPITLTPNGDYILAVLQDQDRLCLVSMRSGRVVRHLRDGDWPPTRITRWRQIAGFDDAGQTVFLVSFDTSNWRTHLLAWNWQSGEVTELLQSDGESVNRAGKTTYWPREYRYIPKTSPPRFLESPPSYGLGDQSVELLVRDSATPDRTVASISTPCWGYFDKHISSDGKRVFIHTRDPTANLAEFDLGSGKLLSRIAPPADHSYDWGRTDRAGTMLILVGTHDAMPRRGDSAHHQPFWERCVFLIRDMSRARWVGLRASPKNWVPQDLCVSPAGESFAVWGSEVGQSGIQLLLYDLSTSLQEELGPSEE